MDSRKGRSVMTTSVSLCLIVKQPLRCSGRQGRKSRAEAAAGRPA
jgi:hypothetical protein